MSVKSDRLELRIDPALKSAAEKAAERDGRSLSGWIKKLIADAVAKEKKR